MPTRKKPGSDEGRDKALYTAKTKNDGILPANRFLTNQTQTRLNAIQPSFRSALEARGTALANQSEGTAVNDAAKAAARMFVSHFFQVFNLGVARGVYTKSQRSFFQLDVNSDSVPTLTSEQDIILWGLRIETGDAARVAAGGAAMVNPTAEEVKEKVNDFIDRNGEQTVLKDAYDIKQEAVETLRVEADKVITKVWDETETFYNEETPSSKRRNCREWGVIYVTDITSTINMLVKDSDDATLLANALCTIVETGAHATTGANGDCVINTNTSDLIAIKVELAGYVTQLVPLEIVDGTTAYSLTVNLVKL
jgi:hypothetical protein